MRRAILATLLTVLFVVLGIFSAQAITGPFTFGGYQWCPTFLSTSPTDPNCNTVQHNKDHANVWNPVQVTQDTHGNPITTVVQKDYQLNGVTYHYQSGVINTPVSKPFSPGDIFVYLTIPCTSSGRVEDWPGFVISGAGVPGNALWPQSGEIDVTEGLPDPDEGTGARALAWHYHYLNASGQAAQIGGEVPGNWCGQHEFQVYWSSDDLDFFYDATMVGEVFPSQIGVPIATNPMRIHIGLGVPDNFTPIYPDASMLINGFGYAPGGS